MIASAITTTSKESNNSLPNWVIILHSMGLLRNGCGRSLYYEEGCYGDLNSNLKVGIRELLYLEYRKDLLAAPPRAALLRVCYKFIFKEVS